MSIFRMGREANIPLRGSILHEEARLIAIKMNRQTFTASNSWLETWKVQHNAEQCRMAGENSDV